MSEAVEGGAAIAWRLLATLEGGSLLLATSALLAYSVRGRPERRKRLCKSVLTGLSGPETKLKTHCIIQVSNTTCKLGEEIKKRLESHGCIVSTVTSGATSGAEGDIVDALVVVGAIPKASSLNEISDMVSEDIYHNLKLLESLSVRVSSHGCIAWACASAEAEAVTGNFANTAAAFETVLQASLQHVAKVRNCHPIWIARCGREVSADRVVDALMSPNTSLNTCGSSIRYAAHTVGEYFYRWLKTIT